MRRIGYILMLFLLLGTIAEGQRIQFWQIQPIPSNRLTGRASTGLGNIETIEVGAGLNLDNTTGILTATGTPISFGATEQVPYMNATGDDFIYSSNFTFDGTILTGNRINSTNGYTIGGVAALGAFLRGDGTNFISGSIQAGDIPSSFLQSGDNISELTNDVGYTTNTGTVTSITAGAGLTGGTITGVGIIDADFGTTAGTIAEGDDSRFHDAVTIGTANGLSLSTQQLSLAAANGSTTGALTAADWTTFNNKLSDNQTITLSGDVTGSGATAITTTISNSAVTYAKMQDQTGVSVLGRSANSTGVMAPITAGSDNQFLVRRSGALSFGALQSSDITTAGGINGSGTVNYVPIFTASGAIGNSSTLFHNTEGGLSIGTTSTNRTKLRLGATFDTTSSTDTPIGANIDVTTNINEANNNRAQTGTNSILRLNVNEDHIGGALYPRALGINTIYTIADGKAANRITGSISRIQDTSSSEGDVSEISGHVIEVQTVGGGTVNTAVGLLVRMLSGSNIVNAWGIRQEVNVNNYFNGNTGFGTTTINNRIDANGSINASAGYKFNNTAPSGNYLRGNGTNFVSGSIQASDLPTQLNNHIISGTSAVTGEALRVTNSTPTTLFNVFNGGGANVGSGAFTAAHGVLNAETGFRVNDAATTGNVLRGNGTNFVSSTLAFADLASTPTTLSGYGITDAVENLEDLSNVVITTPANGEVLTYNGTNWINDTGGGGSQDLDDVLTEGNTTTQTAIFNTTTFPYDGVVVQKNGTTDLVKIGADVGDQGRIYIRDDPNDDFSSIHANDGLQFQLFDGSEFSVEFDLFSHTTSAGKGIFSLTSLDATRTFTLQNKTGTIAHTDDNVSQFNNDADYMVNGALINLLNITEANRDLLTPSVGDMLFCTDCTANDASTGVTQTWNGSAWKSHW